MRLFLTACLLLQSVAASAAHLPLKINFQGKLLDPVTNEPRNGAFNMTFRVYNALTGGTALYTETQTGVAVSNGVFSVQVGSVTALQPELFQGASAYLSVQVSPDAEMSPRQQFNMAAYAFTAAQLVGDGDVPVRVDNVYSTFTSAGNLLLVGGVSASSGVFVNGVTASSGTFTATGASQYGVAASSGLLMNAGTLRLAAASRGLDATGTGVVASTGSFLGAGNGVYSLTTSSGIRMSAGTLAVDGGGGLVSLFGVFAASASFGTVSVSTPASVVTLTADNTLVTVGNQGFIKITSNDATSTNRTFCLTSGRAGQLLVLHVPSTAGTNEIELTDGAVTGLGSCTVANGAMATALVGVWPANANQPGDTGIFIFDGTTWIEIARAAN